MESLQQQKIRENRYDRSTIEIEMKYIHKKRDE